jgi:hypothetical protein
MGEESSLRTRNRDRAVVIHFRDGRFFEPTPVCKAESRSSMYTGSKYKLTVYLEKVTCKSCIKILEKLRSRLL